MLRRWKSMTRQFGIINWFDNVNWPSLVVSKLTFKALALRQSKRIVKFYFHRFLFLFFMAGKYLIGLTDWNQEGVYRWKGTRDNATYFNWETGYPYATNIEKDRDCVVISSYPDNLYKKWSTVQCTKSWMYICECKSACP